VIKNILQFRAALRLRGACRTRLDPEVLQQAVAQACELCKIGFMERDHVIAALKAHEQELRTAGVESVSLFGSVARGEEAVGDVDLAVRLGEGFSAPGLDYFSRLSEIEGRLSGILGCKVDVIEEPVRKKRFQTEIDRDRAIAF
jgi:predicted nucleotidyltransferase